MIPILIESDLLLAYIRREDRLKPVAKRILEQVDSGALRGVYASTAAIQEIVFWFYNRQMFEELVEAVNALVHIRNLEWVDVTPYICLTASILMSEYGVSPFDAYHVATAIAKDKTIISTEHVYDSVRGVKRIDPREME
ncbi:MAG: type II toxin-antitoxin system VapC family toxin [Candidatus Geothermarchaeales archaeon]